MYEMRLTGRAEFSHVSTRLSTARKTLITYVQDMTEILDDNESNFGVHRFEVEWRGGLIDILSNSLYGPYGDVPTERRTPSFRLRGARPNEFSCHQKEEHC